MPKARQRIVLCTGCCTLCSQCTGLARGPHCCAHTDADEMHSNMLQHITIRCRVWRGWATSRQPTLSEQACTGTLTFVPIIRSRLVVVSTTNIVSASRSPPEAKQAPGRAAAAQGLSCRESRGICFGICAGRCGRCRTCGSSQLCGWTTNYNSCSISSLATNTIQVWIRTGLRLCCDAQPKFVLQQVLMEPQMQSSRTLVP